MDRENSEESRIVIDSSDLIVLGRIDVKKENITLKEGEEYCPMCDGNARTYGPGTISTCAYCDGIGKVDWLFKLGEKQKRDEEWGKIPDGTIIPQQIIHKDTTGE